jgi:hypothetical protein
VLIHKAGIVAERWNVLPKVGMLRNIPFTESGTLPLGDLTGKKRKADSHQQEPGCRRIRPDAS